MKILFLGDVMGRAGRDAVAQHLTSIRSSLSIDFVIINAENSTHGMGLNEAHAKALFAAGADCLTLGDHAFDQSDMLTAIEKEPRILRPLNYAKMAPGKGARVFEAPNGKKVLVMQALGQVFMKQPFADPFSAVDSVLKTYALGKTVNAIIVDIHAEATSEKMAMGHWCDGRASLVVGTHTHIPTADTQILKGGTAFQADAGMTGDYDSVIGMEKLEPIKRFVTGMASKRFQPATGEATLSGVVVETDDQTGLAKTVEAFRYKGRLKATHEIFQE